LNSSIQKNDNCSLADPLATAVNRHLPTMKKNLRKKWARGGYIPTSNRVCPPSLCPFITPISEQIFDKFTGFSAIRAFLDDSSASAFFQLTVFGRGFNNDKGHRKDLWLRLLVSLPNVQQFHESKEWIDGSNRYLRKELGRKDDHVNFNRTRNETDFVPFEFNLAKMLQGQRKNYESARVK
jgi:hypothetical protein